jgi:hypothetical protein
MIYLSKGFARLTMKMKNARRSPLKNQGTAGVIK